MQRKHLLPRPRADGYAVRDRVAQKIVHRLAACRIELKEAFLGIARKEALAFEWFIPEEVNVTDALPIGYEDDEAF